MTALNRFAKRIGLAALLAGAAGLIAALFRPRLEERLLQDGAPTEDQPDVEHPEHFEGEVPAHRIRKWLPGRPTLVVLAVAATLVTGVIITVWILRPGPEQPVPFSHRLHVSTKDLSCFFCHSSALESASAGLPSVDKCLLCHDVIVPRWGPVAKIAEYRDRGEGIPWVRVNRVPDFVRFSHQSHLARGVDCVICHGNIAAMDRVKQQHRFTMGFCVDCHTDNRVSTDCHTCHY